MVNLARHSAKTRKELNEMSPNLPRFGVGKENARRE